MSALRYMDHPVGTHLRTEVVEKRLRCTALHTYIHTYILLHTRTQTAEWIVGARVALVKTIYIRI